MTARHAERALRAVAPPEEVAAERRARALLDEAFAQRVAGEASWPAAEPGARSGGRPWSPAGHWRALALGAATCALALAFALTPPGDAVARWVKRLVTAEKPGRRDARPGLRSLPGGGRLLVASPAGAWVVASDGAQRRLGSWTGVAWSPHGLFVAGWRGDRLAAMDPRGVVHWALTRPAPIRGAAWSPDGFRVAYLSADELRVVVANGTGDHPLAQRAGPAAPVWSPLVLHRLAYATATGRVRVVDADSGARAWRSGPGPAIAQLAWSADGRRLVALTPRSLRIFNERGVLLRRAAARPGVRNVALVFAPAGRRPALIRTGSVTGRSEVVTFRVNGGLLRERRLFAGPGDLKGLAFSPDGHWLLVGWRAANQWLFLHPADQRVVAVSAIAAQFAPGRGRPAGFPLAGGWCC